MNRKSYTVILVPHTRAKFRKFQVTNVHLWVVVALVLAFGATSGYVTWSYMTTPVDEAQVHNLQQENSKLREVNVAFEDDIRKLQEQLDEYEERTRQLAIVAGLDDVGVGSESGIGGASPLPDGDYEGGIDTIKLRLGDLASELSAVEEQLDERFRWVASTPAISPTRGLFTSGYGSRPDPITGARAFHQGLDISASPGKPVVATADGIVVQAERSGRLGNAIYLSHGFGLTTRYGHLSKLAVEPGDEVERGDVIGYVGNTGRSTGYHLHYEVRKDGEPVNPLAYILDRPKNGP